ncbi:MAG: gliding motility-associated C-terminal domain-containing protein, partial [Chitinophagaceae bacterium]
FGGCSTASVPNSSSPSPAPFSYNTPGIYTVTQTIDIGLPTQAATCRTIVVLDKLPHLPVRNISICAGDSIKLGSSVRAGNYSWSNGATGDSVFISTPGYHWVETERFGCSNRDSFLVTINPAPTVRLGNDTLICDAATLLLDAGNPGASFLWNTGSINQTITVATPGEYSVSVTSGGCVRKDTIQIGLFDLEGSDFTYSQDVCDGRAVTYSAQIPGYTTISWDFGDGNTQSGGLAPSHNYTSFGTYNVIMNVSYNGCQTSVAKKITIALDKDPQLIVTPDTTICINATKQLRASQGLSYCWYPADFLDDPSVASPITSATQNITYYLHSRIVGANTVKNGDFSRGNDGFSSDYKFTAVNGGAGEYGIATTPTIWNQGMNGACRDHTSGSGNMLLVNGPTASKSAVWKQVVTIKPSTNYAFSIWVQTISSPNEASLRFVINGKVLEQPLIAPTQQCNWRQHFITWTSGDTSQAELSIINLNPGMAGNDFALDDISFAEVFLRQDSVKIYVESPLVTANADTVVCAGQPVQLNAGGASQYEWSPSTALSNAGIANPMANPLVITPYVVKGTTAAGCVARDTVILGVYPKADIAVHADTTICKNSSLPVWVSGGVSYQWSPASSVSDPAVAMPVVSPTGNTMYHISVTDINSCKYEDSIKVDIIPDPVFTVNAPVSACLHDTASLHATGGDVYSWSPAAGLNDPSLASPAAAPGGTVNYSVTITENVCHQSATLQTRITVLPLPDIQAGRSNDIDCSNGQSILQARGARSYSWIPAAHLSNALISNPTASPKTTTTYVVAGTDRAGCTNYDSVTVMVNKANPSGYLMPSAFTPNNDGLNDCYGVKYWGMVSNIEFSVFDRWGVRVFYAKDPNACWDGTYKGEKQPGGVYVYMIRASTDCEDPVFRKGTFVLIR